MLNVLTAEVDERLMSQVYITAFLFFVLGIFTTHVYRAFIKQQRWLRMNPGSVIPRMVAGSAVCGLIYTLLYGSIADLFLPGIEPVLNFDNFVLISNILNFTFLMLSWNLLYFGFHLFENYRIQEIRNLQLKASMAEIELNQLKSQLNPHFMFNAMNSIRALIDEDPARAREALTLLSVILRNTLIQGRKKEITLGEEMDIVRKYLSLEKMRFEERLLVEISMDEELRRLPFPPLLLQTIAENGIKHGISKLPAGGLLRITAKKSNGGAIVEVFNNGIYSPEEGSQGIGIENTRKRLEILYGRDASFEISQSGDYVKASIHIPWKNPSLKQSS